MRQTAPLSKTRTLHLSRNACPTNRNVMEKACLVYLFPRKKKSHIFTRRAQPSNNIVPTSKLWKQLFQFFRKLTIPFSGV